MNHLNHAAETQDLSLKEADAQGTRNHLQTYLIYLCNTCVQPTGGQQIQTTERKPASECFTCHLRKNDVMRCFERI